MISKVVKARIALVVIVTLFTAPFIDTDCEKLLYTLRQTRLALGKNLDKVGRLVLTDSDEVLGYEEEYKGQKVVKDPEEYDRLMNKFGEIENFDANDIYLIDPYGFIMMRYDRSMNPKGIIKDVERLIKNSS